MNQLPYTKAKEPS